MTLRDLHASISAYDEVLFGPPLGVVSTCEDHHDDAEHDGHHEHRDAEPTIRVELVVPSVSLTIPTVVNDDAAWKELRRRDALEVFGHDVPLPYVSKYTEWWSRFEERHSFVGGHDKRGRFGTWAQRCTSWPCPYHGARRAQETLEYVAKKMEKALAKAGSEKMWHAVAFPDLRARRSGRQREDFLGKRMGDRDGKRGGFGHVRVERWHTGETHIFAPVALPGRLPPTDGDDLTPQAALDRIAAALAPGVEKVSGPWRKPLPSRESRGWTIDVFTSDQRILEEAVNTLNIEYGGRLLPKNPDDPPWCGDGLDSPEEIAAAVARFHELIVHMGARRAKHPTGDHEIVATTSSDTPQLLQQSHPARILREAH